MQVLPFELSAFREKRKNWQRKTGKVMKTKDFEFSAPTNRAENWKGNENKVLNIKMVKCIKF